MSGEKRKDRKSDEKSSFTLNKKLKINSEISRGKASDGDATDSDPEDDSRITVKILNTLDIINFACNLLNVPLENNVIAIGNISVTPAETLTTLKRKIMDLVCERFPLHNGGFEFINIQPDPTEWLQWVKSMECKTERLPPFIRIEVIYIRLTDNEDNPISKAQVNTEGEHCAEESEYREGRQVQPFKNHIIWRTNCEDPMVILTELINKHFKGFVGVTQLKEKAKKIAEEAYFNWLDNLPNRHPGHIVIVGNPGVGKTTGAIALANFLIDANLVLSEVIIEAHRDDLVDKYVGGTELKTNDIIHSAKGGVIIFDEIYTLHKPTSPNDTGKEALTTIMKYMTCDCAPVFMFLGYKDHMHDFVNMNPGFQRRIKYTIELNDYSCDDLSRIVLLKLKDRPGIQLKDGLRTECYFRELRPSYLRLHNASVTIRLIDYALDNARQRVLALPHLNRQGATVLKETDFEAAFHRIKLESEEADNSSPPIFGMYK